MSLRCDRYRYPIPWTIPRTAISGPVSRLRMRDIRSERSSFARVSITYGCSLDPDAGIIAHFGLPQGRQYTTLPKLSEGDLHAIPAVIPFPCGVPDTIQTSRILFRIVVRYRFDKRLIRIRVGAAGHRQRLAVRIRAKFGRPCVRHANSNRPQARGSQSLPMIPNPIGRSRGMCVARHRCRTSNDFTYNAAQPMQRRQIRVGDRSFTTSRMSDRNREVPSPPMS